MFGMIFKQGYLGYVNQTYLAFNGHLFQDKKKTSEELGEKFLLFVWNALLLSDSESHHKK